MYSTFEGPLKNSYLYSNPNGPYADSSVFDFVWLPTSAENPLRYLSISDRCEMRLEYQERRIDFWNRVRMMTKPTMIKNFSSICIQ